MLWLSIRPEVFVFLKTKQTYGNKRNQNFEFFFLSVCGIEDVKQNTELSFLFFSLPAFSEQSKSARNTDRNINIRNLNPAKTNVNFTTKTWKLRFTIQPRKYQKKEIQIYKTNRTTLSPVSVAESPHVHHQKPAKLTEVAL